MNQKKLEASLAKLPLGKIAYFGSIGSTNDLAAQWAHEGVPDLSVIVADEQTAGRGRAGRTWFTPPKSALAFSLVLDPSKHNSQAELQRGTGLGALAVCEGLKEVCGLEAEIKWPNDVLVDHKKACGILLEADWLGSHLQTLVLGIGINVAPPSVPPPAELSLAATSIEEAAGRSIDRLELLTSILGKLIDLRTTISSQEFLAAWEARLAYRGERVQVLSGNDVLHEGKVAGLNENGELILLTSNDQKISIQTGEIRVRSIVDRDTN